MAFRDLTGLKFGRLTAVRVARRTGGNVVWTWACECGTEIEVPGSRVTGGNTKSCGCWLREYAASLRTSHGKSKTPEYVTWSNMIARCEYTGRRDYKHYGGRGIIVCSRWRNSFESFLEDVGPRPFLRATLERKDVNGNYEPGNCMWVSQKQQTRNKRNNCLITYNGITKTLADWSDECGVPQRMLRDRIFDLGWPLEEAMNPERKSRWSRRPRTHSTP